MKPTGMVSLVFGIFLVLLLVLALQGSVAGDWNTIGSNIALIMVMIAFFGLTAATIIHFLRK